MNYKIKASIGFVISIVGASCLMASLIFMKYWFVIVVVLTTLKLSGLIAMDWFGMVDELSAIGTGLWLFTGGFIGWFLFEAMVKFGNRIIDNS